MLPIVYGIAQNFRITRSLFQHNESLPDLDSVLESRLRDGCYRPNTLDFRCSFINVWKHPRQEFTGSVPKPISTGFWYIFLKYSLIHST